MSKLEHLRNIFRGIVPHHGGDLDPSYGGQEIVALFRRIKLDESDVLFLKEHPKASEVLQFISHVNIFCNTEEMVKSSVDSEQEYLKSFKLYVSENCSKAKMCTANKCKSLNFLCLDPSLVVRRMVNMKPHSIIFTGTTITPFHQLKAELGILESNEFISKSIIEDHQVSCIYGSWFCSLPFNNDLSFIL